MRKALGLALAALCLRPSLAADLEIGRAPELVAPAALAGLCAQLPAVLPAVADPGKLAALMDRAAALQAPEAAQTPQAPAGPQFVARLQQIFAPYTADDIKNMPAADLEALARRVMDGAAAPSPAAAPEARELPAAALEPAETAAAAQRRGVRRELEALPGPSSPAAAEAAPATVGRWVYLLSKPLEVSAKLGPVAKAAHYAFESSFHLVKSWLLWRAGVPVPAVAAEFAWSAAKAPAMISIQSMGDLQLRYWWAKLKTLRSLARIPDVERIAVLTGTETRFSKVVAARQDNRGLIFLETSRPLKPMATLGLGEPILIEDPRATRIQLSLEVGGREHPSAWNPSLQDLLDRKPLPDDVGNVWRDELRDAKKDMTPWRRFFDADFERNLKVTAVLISPDASRKPLGALAQGQSVKRLLGITRVDQALRAAKLFLGIGPGGIQTIFSTRETYPRRSIPLGDTAVERKPAAVSLGELPSRLRRRLTGRLITVKPTSAAPDGDPWLRRSALAARALRKGRAD